MRRGEWVVLALAALAVLPGLGLREAWPPDEPRYLLAAVEMVRSGDWGIPTRGHEIYSDKPPLFMWAEAAILSLGVSRRLAFQLPSLLAALGTLGLTFDLGRRLWNRRVGLWAAGLLAVTVQFVMQARSGQIDAMLCFWTTLGLYGVLRHSLLGPDRRWLVAGSVAMGLGVLTKGVGLLPLLAFVPIALAQRRDWRHLAPRPTRGWGWAPLVVVAVVAAWAVPLWLVVATSGDPGLTAYRDDLFLQQTVHRYVSPTGHHKPPWYFLTSVIPWAWLPTTLALPWLAPIWGRRLRRRDARYGVLLGWIVLVLIFFSFSEGKRGVYLLPMTPALALVAAPAAPLLWRHRGPNRVGFAVTGLVAAMAGWAATRGDRLARAGMEDLALPLVVIAVAAAVALLVARPRRGLAALVVTLTATWFLFGVWIAPRIDDVRSGARLMRAVEARLPADAELAIVMWREQMLLQSRVPVTHFGYRTPSDEQARRAAGWLWRRGAEARVLVPASELDPCFLPGDPSLIRAHRREWHLVERGQVRPACRPVGAGAGPGGWTVGPLARTGPA